MLRSESHGHVPLPGRRVTAEGVPTLTGSLFDEPASAFGRFRVSDALGDGRFGPVYLGLDPDSDQIVIIRAFAEMMTVEQHERFLVALQQLCDRPLDHASIATPIASGSENGLPYLVHTYLPGMSVDEHLRVHGPRPLADVIVRVTHLAAAIDFAAAAGVHHGALSPRDIIFAPNSTGLSGFGLVQAMRTAGLELSAPTLADDVYALAAMTFELLIGHRFTGGSLPHAMAPLRGVVGVDLEALIQALEPALSSSPDRWPETALAFARTLHAARTDSPADTALPAGRVRDRAAHARGPIDVGRLSFGSDDGAGGARTVAHIDHEPDIVRDDAPSFDMPLQTLGLTLDEPATLVRAAEAPALHEQTGDTIRAAEPVPDTIIDAASRHAVASEGTLSAAVPSDRAVSTTTAAHALRKESGATTRKTPIYRASEDPLRPRKEPEPVPVEPLGGAGWRVFLLAGGLALVLLTTIGLWMLSPPSADPAAEPAPTQADAVPPIAVDDPVVTPPTEPESSAPRSTGGAEATPVNEPAPIPSETIAPAAPSRSRGETGRASDARGRDSARPETASPAAIPDDRPRPESARAERRPPGGEAGAGGSAPATSPGTAAGAAGRVLVRSTPAGARVLVDGTPRGQTPAAIRDLTLGTHTIALVAPGYPQWERTITLTNERPSQSFEVALDGSGALTPVASSVPAPTGPRSAQIGLQIESRPSGAQVWLDGAPAGVTPLFVPAVPSGSHQVRIELTGYRPWTTSVSVTAGEQARVAASLEQ